MGFGGHGGGFNIGPTSVQANAEAGLPFAQLPQEFLTRIEKVLENEPNHQDPKITFSHSEWDRKIFTLRSFLSPHKWWLLLALVLVVIETGLQYLGPLLTQIAIDDGVMAAEVKVLIAACFGYIGSIALAAIASFVRTTFTGRLGERLIYELRIRVFSHFQRQSLDFFLREKAGVLMTRMTSDIEALTILFQEGLINFAVQVITLLVITIYLVILNPTLALTCFIVVVPINVIFTLWFRRVSHIGYLRVRDRIADILANLSESLAGIRVITAFNRQKHNISQHNQIVEEHFKANLYTGRAQSLFGPGTESIGVAAQAIILLVGGRMVLAENLSIGEITAFLLFLTSFFAPIQSLVQLYNQYQQGSAAVTKLRNVLATEPSIQEAPNALEMPPISGSIKLESVNFSYKNSLVLHNVNLNIAPGEVLAIVGPTGAGKSTLAKLLIRLYDPISGQIFIDDQNINSFKLSSLRQQIGVVPQEPFLFNGTIKDNISFAKKEATEAEIYKACEVVGLQNLLNRLPDGVNTLIHERGSSLSAGERQLLALARAFLIQPRILILDEATSNLDLLSESQIENALDTVLEGRTALIIAHRLATAMRADRIAVIEHGQITELGSHTDLVTAKGRYSSMYETWMSQASVNLEEH